MMGLSCFKSWKHDRARHKGNRDVLASPGSYFFLSNSAGQGDEWLKTLNKGVWIPFTGVFGQRLEETVLYERKYGVRLVPLVVEQCVNFIRDRGLHEVGLFRQPGHTRVVQQLRQAYDAGQRPTFDSSTDVHTVASLLKLYLRQLPEPLVPYSQYQDFLLCGHKLSTNRSRGLVELRSLLQELPVANFNLLNFICQFLNEVQSYSSSNRMSCQNLATVFGPNILRAKGEDPQSIMGGAALVQILMLELIQEYHSLFSKVPPPSSSGAVCQYRGPIEQTDGAPCLRQLSLPLITEKDSEGEQSYATKSDFYQKKHLGHRYTSSHPDTCLFFPQRSSSPYHNLHHSHHHQEEDPAPLSIPKPDILTWTEPWADLRDPNVDYWTPVGPPNEGLASHRCSSSDQDEESTPSAYDNIDKESSKSGSFENLNKKVEQNVASPASFSSCEIFPLEECFTPAQSPKSPKRHTSLPTAEMAEDDDENIEKEFESFHFTTPTSRSEHSDSPLSTGSSEVFLPCGPPELQDPDKDQENQGESQKTKPRDPHSMLVELQQQMAQQRVEYQARIHRLERCNDVLERQIAILRLSLEQQKRSQSVAETKIRNMERAKEDADERNSKLQSDMDMFLQMYRPFKRHKEHKEHEEHEEPMRSRDRGLQSL